MDQVLHLRPKPWLLMWVRESLKSCSKQASTQFIKCFCDLGGVILNLIDLLLLRDFP